MSDGYTRDITIYNTDHYREDYSPYYDSDDDHVIDRTIARTDAVIDDVLPDPWRTEPL